MMLFVAIPHPFWFTVRTRKYSLAVCACQRDSERDPNESSHSENIPPHHSGESFVSQRSYHEIPSTSVDWDFEWVKYVATGKIESKKSKPHTLWGTLKGQRAKFPMKPPLNVPRLSLLAKDWRFWIITLLTVSMIMAAIQHSHNPMTGSGFI
ncbi:hypothetical protein Gasu2_31570 [Galdieria sulphuraria]|uniref:Uncharacterized protein n=1 Tax=Galdieria sulphuraria TaxID=130081 RepID=M2XXB6_GALSU|nr:uncharacterized protein Gasu_42730 [Galdieria sulphuraria]EME28273.1 hypothetical protein Gasu_42730 [Galdieria sulphuraria]GJD08876.1 hypothetical protein Gasu2_31570 [Galdieria sulphuraria]|eukprot:XP_005704793.1 hypothetical protein Gasu_42730 [Galdieria sulphuraria]